jgi:hypothetical protein
VNFTVHSPVS